MDLQQTATTLERITLLTLAVMFERGKRVLVAPKVRALMEHALAVEERHLSQDECAGRLFMTAPTVRRYLMAEGTSYQKIADDCRMRLAKHLLAKGLTVDEVAYRLGFSAPPALSRAFKDWTGISPREYRLKWSPSISLSEGDTPTRTATSRSQRRIGQPAVRKW